MTTDPTILPYIDVGTVAVVWSVAIVAIAYAYALRVAARLDTLAAERGNTGSGTVHDRGDDLGGNNLPEGSGWSVRSAPDAEDLARAGGNVGARTDPSPSTCTGSEFAPGRIIAVPAQQQSRGNPIPCTWSACGAPASFVLHQESGFCNLHYRRLARPSWQRLQHETPRPYVLGHPGGDS